MWTFYCEDSKRPKGSPSSFLPSFPIEEIKEIVKRERTEILSLVEPKRKGRCKNGHHGHHSQLAIFRHGGDDMTLMIRLKMHKAHTQGFLAHILHSPLNELILNSSESAVIYLVVPNRHAWAQWLRRVSSFIASVFAKVTEPN